MSESNLTPGLYISPPLQKYPNCIPFTFITNDHKYMGLEVMGDHLFAKGAATKVISVQVSGKGQKQRGNEFKERKDVKVITLVSKTLT